MPVPNHAVRNNRWYKATLFFSPNSVFLQRPTRLCRQSFTYIVFGYC